MGNLDRNIVTDVGAVLLQQIAPFIGTGFSVEDPINLCFPLAFGRGLIQHETWIFTAVEHALFDQCQIVIFDDDHIAHAMFCGGDGDFSDTGKDWLVDRTNRVLGFDHHVGIGTSDLDARVVYKATVGHLETHPRITKGILSHAVRR